MMKRILKYFFLMLLCLPVLLLAPGMVSEVKAAEHCGINITKRIDAMATEATVREGEAWVEFSPSDDYTIGTGYVMNDVSFLLLSKDATGLEESFYDGKYTYNRCKPGEKATVLAIRLYFYGDGSYAKIEFGPNDTPRYRGLRSVDFSYLGGVFQADNSDSNRPYYVALIPFSDLPGGAGGADGWYIDYDTYKSEAPGGTVIAAGSVDAKEFFDFKVHPTDDKNAANQKLLAKGMLGPNAQAVITKDIHPRRDLSVAENGASMVLKWNSLPKNQAGLVKAVVYNQTDGAYVINGTLDNNGTAVFTGFKLRSASTVTICK